MPRIILRVDDVGRVPGDTPENGTDGDLDYFFAWREAVGLAGFPVYYGIVPGWLSRRGYTRLMKPGSICGFEDLALHGWCHRRGEVLPEHMRVGSMLLDTNVYVPPYNDYQERDIINWGTVGGQYFLGGFQGDHHNYGEAPVSLWETGGRKLIHVSACRELYGHASSLLPNSSEFQQWYPIVCTLHVPWDTFEAAASFVQTIKPHLVLLDQVQEWLDKQGE